MNKDTWNSLSADAQKKWDELESKDKATILNYATERAEKSPKTISANVAYTSATSDSAPSASEPDPPHSDESSGERQANVTNASKAKSAAHPGDVRRVLGGPPPKGKSGDKSTGSRSGYNVSWEHIPLSKLLRTCGEEISQTSPRSLRPLQLLFRLTSWTIPTLQSLTPGRLRDLP